MKKLFNERSLRAIALEMVSVVAAVLIALGVSEWNQNRTHQQNVVAALQKITSEMAQNIAILEITLKNNQQIVDNLSDPNQGGQYIPALQIQQTAWNTALSTGTSKHMSYDKLYALSKVYSLQEVYKSFSYKLVETMMHTNAMAIALDPEIKSSLDVPSQSFDDYFVLVVSIETALLDSFKKAHAELKAEGF